MRRLILVLFVVAGSAAAQEPPVLAEARRALAENIPQVAIAKLQKALKSGGLKDRAERAALRLLAEAQLAAGQPEVALATLNEPPLRGGTDLETQLLRAASEAGGGKWAEALHRYQAITQAPDAPVEARLGQAECLQALGRTGEAAAVLEALQASGSAPVAAQLRLVSLYVELSEGAKARKALATIEAEQIADVKWRDYLMARILLLEGNPKAALPILEQMLADKTGLSGNLVAAVALATTEAQRKLSGPDTAAKTLESFIRQFPSNPQIELVFRRLDQFYEEDNNPQEGPLHGFFTELTGTPASALGQFYVARMQVRENRDAKARTSLDIFLKKFPQHDLIPYAYQMLAELEKRAGNLAGQVRALEDGLRVAKAQELRAELALSIALVHLQQGEFARAATRLKEAANSRRLKQAAAYNEALGWLWQNNYECFRDAVSEFAAQFHAPALIGQLRLEEGLVQAREGHGEAAGTLRGFVRAFPEHPRRSEAQIAMAELAFLKGENREAETLLVSAKEPPTTPQNQEQADYLAVFLADKKQPRDAEEVIRIAKSFIAQHPNSPLLPEVRMKLGQVYFAEEDYLKAQEQFETVAAASASGTAALTKEEAARREVALFLAGQCGMKLINTEALNHALELFDKVAERKGAFELHARLQQAIIKNKLGAEDDAVKIYDTIISATAPVDPELRFAALVGKGDNLVSLAQKEGNDPAAKEQSFRRAIETYDLVINTPEVNATWRNRAAYKKGKALQQLGLVDEALTVFYDVLEKNAQDPNGGETFWYAKAGFDAAGLLEARQQWKNAVGVYEKMAGMPGAHVAQAKQRVKTLQLEHFLWD